MPKVSICVPAHYGMKDYQFFMDRLIKSVESQTFKDYELIVTHEGKMAANTNAAMKQAKGEIVKILYMDDYFTHENSLQEIVDAFELFPKHKWLASGCVHDDGSSSFLRPHLPYYSSNIHTGNNTIGSPSVVTLQNGLGWLFDPNLSWLLDCDFYKRLHDKWGEPILLNTFNVTLGVGPHQTTHIMSNEEKQAEADYLLKKYA